jgi:hypothetical protein
MCYVAMADYETVILVIAILLCCNGRLLYYVAHFELRMLCNTQGRAKTHWYCMFLGFRASLSSMMLLSMTLHMFLMDASWLVTKICHPNDATIMLSHLVHCTLCSLCIVLGWIASIVVHNVISYMGPSL